MNRTCISLLAYTDNIVLLGEEEQKIVDSCDRLIESAKKSGTFQIPGLYCNTEK